MKKFYSIVMAAMLCFSAFAQNTYNGRVTDESGEALVGVNVIVKHSYKGTITNTDGRFSISGKADNAVLVFSYVGYETQEVKASADMSVQMETSAVLTDEIIVSAIRASKNVPVAASEMTSEEIQKQNFGQDLPFLLNQMPSVVTNSDAGAGVGYTGLRIRGADITRINVTVNGIPMNDAESQGVFWVNMPDFAASVDKVQVQRGVGTSTNGAASFGASINLNTLNSAAETMAFIDNSYGSYNTMKNSVAVSTGLLKNNMAFDVRLSRINSDGFIDRATSDLKSYYFSGGYYGEKSTLKFITFSGEEKTYQAWYGVPKVKLENDQAGMEKLVMMDGWTDAEAENLYTSDARTFNKYLYDNQTDNYQQDHYQLHYTHQAGDYWQLTAAQHYTKGEGYYESYKNGRKFKDYNVGFESIDINGETIEKTDLIQRKWLDNDFYGGTFSGIYTTDKLELIIGGAYNEYDGDHFGNVIWSQYNNGIPHNHQWYFNTGRKKDFNSYIKATWALMDNLWLYGDIQYRNVNFSMTGEHDDNSDLTQSYSFDFVNPKMGINYKLNQNQRVFASFAVAQREPTRSDFRDAPADRKPEPETLYDWELGYEYNSNKAFVNVNGFYMLYKDQLVQTGEINDVGAAIMVNVPDSYRAGVEIEGGVLITSNFNWTGNIALSANKIKNYTEYVDNWSYWDDPENEPYQYVTELGETDIAFSPSVTAASQFNFMPAQGLTLSLLSKYVGDQYIDNTSNDERMLDAWLVNDILVNYDFTISSVGDFNLGIKFNNIFDEEYESNAWVYRYYYAGEHDVLDGYFPQAGRNVMVRLGMKF
ncbi:TonB-dependent receptor [Carboxylicivirga sp. RSCT41]|uniref:TonB-dependent receptor n=1 Tax=Carboxylicivirga agarovorans TaxID=3417570 RepID=UPI003D33CFAD